MLYSGIMKFKSYYVVWKPQVGCEVMSSQREFKSYYVVWKQKKEKYKKYQVYGV